MSCEIRVCASGCIHVVFGNVTVTFRQDDFLEFARGTGQVAADLRVAQRGGLPQDAVHRLALVKT